MILRLFFLLLTLILSLPGSFAQVVTATAELDTSRILIGGHANFTISVRYPMGTPSPAITWDGFRDTITSKIEILNHRLDTTISTNGKTVLIHHKFKITSFDSGFVVIPPIPFYKMGDTSKPVSTQALLLEVLTVPVDTTQPIKEIYEPFRAPFSIKEALPWIIGGAIILFIAALAFYLYWRKKQAAKKPLPPPPPPLPAHEHALKELDKLEKEELWQKGLIKDYYTGITRIIRDYLEDRFKINAQEQTSSEILYSLRMKITGTSTRENLRELLLLSDMVKFAKEEPLPDENKRVIANAREFIQQTKEEVKPVIEKEEGGENA